MVRTSRPLVERMTLDLARLVRDLEHRRHGSQRLMINQNELFRRHGLGSFHELLLDVTKDPAMLLWLNGSDNSKDYPNENYAREMMELFTLGADRGYTENDVRQQARALTGFRNGWSQNSGPDNFRYDRQYHDPGVKTIFHHRGRFTWKDSCRLCVTHPDHASFFIQKLWSYFVPESPDHATQRALERLYKSSRYEVRPVVAAILRHPDLYRGPRLVKPPVVYNAGNCSAGSGAESTPPPGSWLDAMAGQQLFYPPNVAGWNDDRWLDTATWRGRWWIAQEVLDRHALDPRQGPPARQRERTPRTRLPVLARPSARTRHAARAPHLHAAGTRRRQGSFLEVPAVPRDGPERTPPADRRLAGVAGGMTNPCNHCDGPLALAASPPRAGGGRRRAPGNRDRGCRPPAGTGLSRRRFLVGSLSAAIAVYGGSKLGLRALEEGIAAAASGPASPILVSVFLEGGADGLSVLSPQGDPLYKKLRPQLALSGGAALAEDDRLYWHPALGGIQQLYAEKKVTVLPAVGYTHADQSHFTSRHYWEVGATEADLRTGWMGRYLDRVGKRDNPLQGLYRSTTPSRPPSRPASVPVASISGADQYDFYSERVWGEVEQRMLEAIGLMGHQPADAGLRTAGSVAAQVDRLRQQLLPFQSSNGFSSPVPYPKSDDPFPQRLAGLAAMLAAGLPLHCVALTAPGEYDTHADEPTALSQGLQLTSDSFWRSSATSKHAASPTASSCTSGRSSDAARRRERRQRHRPRRRRDGFPPRDTRGGGNGRRIPRPPEGTRQRQQCLGHLRLPGRLRSSARAVVRGRRRHRHPQSRLLLPAEAGRMILAPQAQHPPARVQVVAQEFRYTLSRTKVRAGRVIVEARQQPPGHARPRRRAHRQHPHLPVSERAAGPGCRPRAEAGTGQIPAVVRDSGSSRARHARNASRRSLEARVAGRRCAGWCEDLERDGERAARLKKRRDVMQVHCVFYRSDRLVTTKAERHLDFELLDSHGLIGAHYESPPTPLGTRRAYMPRCVARSIFTPTRDSRRVTDTDASSVP